MVSNHFFKSIRLRCYAQKTTDFQLLKLYNWLFLCSVWIWMPPSQAYSTNLHNVVKISPLIKLLRTTSAAVRTLLFYNKHLHRRLQLSPSCMNPIAACARVHTHILYHFASFYLSMCTACCAKTSSCVQLSCFPQHLRESKQQLTTDLAHNF